MSSSAAEPERYVIVRLEDIKTLNAFFQEEILTRDFGPEVNSSMLSRLLPLMPTLERFNKEEGATLGVIAQGLKNTPICTACTAEGQAHTCQSIWTQKAGRRLRRLIDRAHGIIRPPKEKEE